VAGFGERIEVVEIQIPVYVTAGGEPVRGLGRDGFAVFDGRRELPIVGFEVIDLGASEGDALAAIPVAARRHFLFLFDLMHAQPQNLLLARRAALELVGEMHASDLAGVATFGPRGVEVLLGFTSDRGQLALALESLGAPQLYEAHPDPLLLSIGVPSRLLGGAGQSTGIGGPSTRRADIEQMVQEHLSAMATAEAVANQLAMTQRAADLVRSMTALGRVFAEAEGRKYAIFFSEGFDSRLLTGGEGLVREQRNALDVDITDARLNPHGTFGQVRLRSDMERMLEQLRRADVMVHSVDVGRLRAGGRGAGEEVLLLVSRDTGGQLFSNFNDLGAALRQLAAGTAVTYLLSVRVDPAPGDRRFHDLRVRLRGAPRGADVRHRMGYYPPDPAVRGDVTAARLELSQRLLGGVPQGRLPVAVLAAPGPASSSGVSVPVLVEIEGAALARGSREGSVVAEIYAYAFDREGEVAAFFSKTLGFDLAKVGPAFDEGGGARYCGELRLRPGDYSLRVLVREVHGGASRLDVQRLTVPASGDQPVLVGPFLADRRPGWLSVNEAKEVPSTRLLSLATPGALPAAKPVVSANGESEVVLLVAQSLAESLQLDGELRDGAGEPVPGAEIVPATCIATSDDPIRCATTLRVRGVAAGTYRLVLSVAAAERSIGRASLDLRVQ